MSPGRDKPHFDQWTRQCLGALETGSEPELSPQCLPAVLPPEPGHPSQWTGASGRLGGRSVHTEVGLGPCPEGTQASLSAAGANLTHCDSCASHPGYWHLMSLPRLGSWVPGQGQKHDQVYCVLVSLGSVSWHLLVPVRVQSGIIYFFFFSF